MTDEYQMRQFFAETLDEQYARFVKVNLKYFPECKDSTVTQSQAFSGKIEKLKEKNKTL